jgi:hypothetical protein
MYVCGIKHAQHDKPEPSSVRLPCKAYVSVKRMSESRELASRYQDAASYDVLTQVSMALRSHT